MELEWTDPEGLYRADVDRFAAETGATATLAPSSAPVKFADPSSLVAIRVDPETLRSIFAYLAVLGGGAFVLSTDNPENFGMIAMPNASPGVMAPYQERPQSY